MWLAVARKRVRVASKPNPTVIVFPKVLGKGSGVVFGGSVFHVKTTGPRCVPANQIRSYCFAGAVLGKGSGVVFGGSVFHVAGCFPMRTSKPNPLPVPRFCRESGGSVFHVAGCCPKTIPDPVRVAYQQTKSDSYCFAGAKVLGKGSGVVFGGSVFHVAGCCPKTTPDPVRVAYQQTKSGRKAQ
jgi:hypothetical protein